MRAADEGARGTSARAALTCELRDERIRAVGEVRDVSDEMIIERDEDFRAESGGQADEEGGFVNTAQVGPLVLQVLVDALRDLAREFTPA